jgi:hypothetical protein
MIGIAMNRTFLAVVTSSMLVGATFLATPAEARRLFWWQSGNQPLYDVYGDEQDAYVQDQFNQDEYDLYMEQTNRRKRVRYNDNYFDPQIDGPSYDAPRRHLKKKKTVQHIKIAKPVSASKKVVKFNSTEVIEKRTEKPVAQTPQLVSLDKRLKDTTGAKQIDCTKGASIVAGFGFDAVTTKSCSGGTLVYGAMRSGKSFEVQVSATSGELTAVKKL